MKKIFNKKQVNSWKSFKKNVLSNGNVGKIIDKPSEKREFFKALKAESSGGITSREMRKIVSNFSNNTNDHIDIKESVQLADKFLGGARYMRRTAFMEENRVAEIMNRRNADPHSSSDLNLNTDLKSSDSKSQPRRSGYSGMKLVC